jgi:hypothetical protein
MDSEISGLADKHAFLKLGNNVARFAFTYCDMPSIAEDFKARAVSDDELGFDPLTLRPKHRPEPQQTHIPAAAVLATDPEDALQTATEPVGKADPKPTLVSAPAYLSGAEI